MVKENSLKLNNHNYIIVNTAVASIYNNPNFSSELITQALFWEELIVNDKKDNWYQVKQRDGYVGWIHSFYTVDSSVYDNNNLLQDHENWYWVKNKFLTLSLEDNSNLLISYGSLIPCFKEKGQFFTMLPNNKKVNIDINSLIRYTDKRDYQDNILYSTKQLIGSPYLWGGKSAFGFDCSGLLQSIFNVCNVNANNYTKSMLPRDASEQVLSDILIEKKDQPNIGDIIFFKTDSKVDHVGLYINNQEFIHSSGFVKINSIDKENQYYSNKLELNLYGIYEINKKC